MSPRVVAIIEARMASTRLPGKVLLEAAGKPMLQHLVDRLRAVPLIHGIVVATTTAPGDDVIEAFAARAGVDCYRGSADDVMQRVLEAGEAFGAEVVVEVTGDCPIADPAIIERAVRLFLDNDAEYVSNCGERTYPDGMEVQVFALRTLRASAGMTRAPLDREHVTLHIRNNPDLFPPLEFVAPPDQHWPGLGLTLDEPGDFALLSEVIAQFPDDPLFGCSKAVALLRARPDLLEINRGVYRKGDE